MPASEFDLIAAINERLPTAGSRIRVGSGDDAAVVESDRPSAVSVDAIVDGVHFRLSDFGAVAVGRKALAAGLSDLAAMGAVAGEAYVVVGAPDDLDDPDLLGIAEGLAEVASREQVTIAGGDLVASPALVVSVTSIGYEPDGSSLITRSGARPGDVIAVTGELGGAAAAVALLDADDEAPLPAALREALLARQFDPRPRLREGVALAAAGATAMIDVSDGLGADAGHLARASGCGIEIDLGRLPVARGVGEVAGSDDAAMDLAASGGEDYELLVALPEERVAAARSGVEKAGSPLTAIGYAIDGGGVALRLSDGRELDPRGFDQRRGSRSGSGRTG